MGIVCALLAAEEKEMQLVGSDQVDARQKTSHPSNYCSIVGVFSVAKASQKSRVAAHEESIEVSVQVMARPVQHY
jgi:hypothetical protein